MDYLDHLNALSAFQKAIDRRSDVLEITTEGVTILEQEMQKIKSARYLRELEISEKETAIQYAKSSRWISIAGLIIASLSLVVTLLKK